MKFTYQNTSSTYWHRSQSNDTSVELLRHFFTEELMGRQQGIFAMISNFHQREIKLQLVKAFQATGELRMIGRKDHQVWNEGKSFLYYFQASKLEQRIRGRRFDSVFIDIRYPHSFQIDKLEVLIAPCLNNNSTVFVSEIQDSRRLGAWKERI